MSIYKTVLGKNFHRLHPKLQERYTLEKAFNGAGEMAKIETGSIWIRPILALFTHWKFLFPEHGRDIPFTISNTRRTLPNGDEEIYWEREFYFEKVTRYFHARMTIDSKGGIVRDYLGEPSLFYSDLLFEVTSDGSLMIRSGQQRLVLGLIEIPIPKWLKGHVIVNEGYDDVRQAYTINVKIRNRLIGRLMTYDGEFKEK